MNNIFDEEDDHIVIRHPFVVFVEPGDVVDGKLQWNAKIVGHELDNLAWADDPVQALEAALDLVKDLTTPPKYS